MSKEDLLMPARSDSSCSLGKMSAVSTELSTDLSVQLSEYSSTSTRVSSDTSHVSSDCGTLCDTSSEVSDEGYKSSQGNVSQKPDTGASPMGDHDQVSSNNNSEGERLRD